MSPWSWLIFCLSYSHYNWFESLEFLQHAVESSQLLIIYEEIMPGHMMDKDDTRLSFSLNELWTLPCTVLVICSWLLLQISAVRPCLEACQRDFALLTQCQTPSRGSSLLFLYFVLAEYHDNTDTCVSGEAEIGENSMNIWYTCSWQESSKTLTRYSLPVSWSVYWCKFGGINHIKNLHQKLFSPKMQEGLGRGMLVCCETSWHNTRRCILLNRMCMRKTITPQHERERPSTTDISQVIENEAPRTWKKACNCNQNTKATIESNIILHHISIDFSSNYHKILSQIHGSS